MFEIEIPMSSDFCKGVFSAVLDVIAIFRFLPSLHIGSCDDEFSTLIKKNIVRLVVDEEIIEDGPCMVMRDSVDDHR